jgi:ribosomal protein L10
MACYKGSLLPGGELMTTRELTLKETNTATLQARLRTIAQIAGEPIDPVVKLMYGHEAEAIKRELEERNETERKVSRW